MPKFQNVFQIASFSYSTHKDQCYEPTKKRLNSYRHTTWYTSEPFSRRFDFTLETRNLTFGSMFVFHFYDLFSYWIHFCYFPLQTRVFSPSYHHSKVRQLKYSVRRSTLSTTGFLWFCGTVFAFDLLKITWVICFNANQRSSQVISRQLFIREDFVTLTLLFRLITSGKPSNKRLRNLWTIFEVVCTRYHSID